MNETVTTPPLPVAKRPFLAALLSLLIILFIAVGVLEFIGAAQAILFQRHDLQLANGLFSLLLLLAGLLIYCLTGFFPEIPKKWFLPLCLFVPSASIAVLPLLVYFHKQSSWIDLGIALIQILLGLIAFRQLLGCWSPEWPLIPHEKLPKRAFSWKNLAIVTAAPLLVFLPVAVVYLAFSAKLAIEHFTDGFTLLRPGGLTMQVRHYARADGKKITLVPMSHVGESEFYQDIASSFPDEAVVLMEGVTDHDNLLDVHSNYSQIASSVGGVEQVKVFKPKGRIVPADIDMSSLSPSSLDMLKAIMAIHAKGVTPETLPYLMKPTPPDLEQTLFDDILTKRNNHLLKVIEEWLPQADHIIVPWGAAHMAGTAEGIEKLGFKLTGAEEYTAIRFGS